MTTTQNTLTALRNFGEIKATGEDCLIVKRTDHPHISGDWFYAIRAADKHAWTAGERALTQDEIADLWYGAGCPPTDESNPINPSTAVFVVTTGSVPSREISVTGLETAAALADKTNGSYRRDW